MARQPQGGGRHRLSVQQPGKLKLQRSLALPTDFLLVRSGSWGEHANSRARPYPVVVQLTLEPSITSPVGKLGSQL